MQKLKILTALSGFVAIVMLYQNCSGDFRLTGLAASSSSSESEEQVFPAISPAPIRPTSTSPLTPAPSTRPTRCEVYVEACPADPARAAKTLLDETNCAMNNDSCAASNENACLKRAADLVQSCRKDGVTGKVVAAYYHNRILRAVATETGAGRRTDKSLLFNPGPTYLAGKTIANFGPRSSGGPWAGEASWIPHGTDMTETNLAGGSQNLTACAKTNGATWDGVPQPKKAGPYCETFFIDTRVGWLASELLANNSVPGPGFYFTNSRDAATERLIYSFSNLTQGLAETDLRNQVRELGFAFDGPWWSIRVNENTNKPFRLRDFNQIRAQLSARLFPVQGTAVTGPFVAPFGSDVKDSWAYFTIDLRLGVRGTNDEDLRGNLLSLQLYSANPAATSERFWQNYVTGQPCPAFNPGQNTFGCVTMLNSRYLNSIGVTPLRDNGEWTTFDFDLKRVILAFKNEWNFPAHDIEDLEIRGFDVYTSTRGANLRWEVKDIDLKGLTSQ